MRLRVSVLIGAFVALCLRPGVAFAVSEYQMSRPVSSPINQTYLYGERGNTTAHKGLDFKSPDNTPVRSAYAGVAKDWNWSDAEGWWILIDHGSSIYTYYCHLREDPGIRPGGFVKGQTEVTTSTVIGYTGNTGSTANGQYHLHFSVRQGGTGLSYVRNPEKWLGYLSGTGKALGSAWNGGVDPTASARIKIVGAVKSDSTYGSTWTYDRYTFAFGDSEDWLISDVISNLYQLSTSNYGTSKTMWMEITSSSRTSGDFDVGNSINDTYEFNETVSTAASIGFGSSYYSFIFNSKDDDYYRVTPTFSGSLTVSLTSLPKNYNLRLLSSTGTVLATSSNTGTTNEQIVYSVTGNTSYYIHVFGYSSVWDIYDSYDLLATLSPSP